ncbi:hypothetical protein K438DRAFT_1977711 [Mycena galopus ATCC 62051]|nr:hypothetical protein K438DRAFT_1977711 [Mycena galopus ATCC 62051]
MSCWPHPDNFISSANGRQPTQSITINRLWSADWPGMKSKSYQRLDASLPCEVGWRNIIVEHGPEALAKAVREYPGTLMDTTWCDAHQSLLATRLRTADMVNNAKEPSYALANAHSLEPLGSSHMPFLLPRDCSCAHPPQRALRKLVPNIPLQALVRSANGVGYTSYPDNTIYKFSKKAVENGLDIFRVFDSLNYFENVSVDAAKKSGGVCEAVVCYSGDVASLNEKKYTLKYNLDFVDQLVKEIIHVLGVKDMAGLLQPEAAKMYGVGRLILQILVDTFNLIGAIGRPPAVLMAGPQTSCGAVGETHGDVHEYSVVTPCSK